MGYDRLTFSGSARVSRHNDPRDKVDNARWDDFVQRLKLLAEEYEDIEVDVNAIKVGG